MGVEAPPLGAPVWFIVSANPFPPAEGYGFRHTRRDEEDSPAEVAKDEDEEEDEELAFGSHAGLP